MDIQYNRNEETKTVKLPKTSRIHNGDSHGEDGDEKMDAEATTNGADSTSDDEELLDLNDDNEIETTVIFLPNVWSLMPNSIEYQKIIDAYKNYIENPGDEEAASQKQGEQTESNGANAACGGTANQAVAGGDTVDTSDASKAIKALILYLKISYIIY